jgi:predicted transcriptional regulator
MEELKEIKNSLCNHLNYIRNNYDFLIDEKKSTNTELAKLAGISESNYYDVMNNKASVDNTMKLLKVLDFKLYEHLIKEINKK